MCTFHQRVVRSPKPAAEQVDVAIAAFNLDDMQNNMFHVYQTSTKAKTDLVQWCLVFVQQQFRPRTLRGRQQTPLGQSPEVIVSGGNGAGSKRADLEAE